MRLAYAIPLLAVACPAAAQIPTGDIPDGQAAAAPEARQSPERTSPDRRTARTTYGYRLAAPDEDDDPTDRRVLKRLNTRVNNRLETRIERYRFVDTKSERTGTATRNPYAPRPAAGAKTPAPVLRRRTQDDPR